MQESIITTKGQTTLPKEIRSALGVQPGDRLRYAILDGEVRIMKARPARELKGLLASKIARPASLDDMDEAIAAGAAASGKPQA